MTRELDKDALDAFLPDDIVVVTANNGDASQMSLREIQTFVSEDLKKTCTVSEAVKVYLGGAGANSFEVVGVVDNRLVRFEFAPDVFE